MTDRITSDFAALFTPPPSRGVQFSQARVLTWNNETLANTLEWRGITIRDVPLVEGINALTIRAGDIVGILGWAPENAKGVGSWWILGKLSVPGEFVADLNVTAKLFRFVTEDDHTLAFFGKAGDGDPLWILYYGGADETAAIRIVNANQLAFVYRDGQDFLRTSGVSGEQIFQMFDNAGNELIATDGGSDVGLARPYLNIPMVPSSGTSIGTGGPFWPEFVNANYQEVMHGFSSLWHPRINVGVDTSTSSGTVEWLLRLDGVTIGSGSGPGTGTFDVNGWGTTTNPGDVRSVQLWARNTSGASSRLIVDRCMGVQSL